MIQDNKAEYGVWVNHLSRALRILLAVGVIFVPLITALGLLYIRHGGHFWDLTPIWSDEIFYWHQAKTFAATGFNNGYYTVSEIPAPLFSRYYAWGPFIALFYGIPAFFGWHLASITLINLGLLTIALAVWVSVLRPSILQSLAAILLMALFTPFIIYSSSSLLPVLQQAIAVSLSVGFFVLLRPSPPSRPLIIALLVIISVAALIRVTWALLFIPALVLAVRHRSLWVMARMALFGAVLMIAYVFVFDWLSAPFPNLSTGIETPQLYFARLTTMFKALQRNLTQLTQGNELEVHLRWQYVALTAAMIVWGLFLASWRIWRGRQANQNNSKINRAAFTHTLHEIILYGYLLLSVLALVMLLYELQQWRDYRQLAPILLLCGLLLIAYKRWWVIVPLIISFAMVLPPALTVYDLWTGWHLDSAKRAEYDTWQTPLEAAMPYDPQADAWCNTVLHSVNYLFGPTSVLLAVDAGIGLSSPLFDDTPTPPFKSGYLLFIDDMAAEFQTRINMQHVLDVPQGAIYRNLDSGCWQP